MAKFLVAMFSVLVLLGWVSTSFGTLGENKGCTTSTDFVDSREVTDCSVNNQVCACQETTTGCVANTVPQSEWGPCGTFCSKDAQDKHWKYEDGVGTQCEDGEACVFTSSSGSDDDTVDCVTPSPSVSP